MQPAPAERVSVLIADDQRLVRTGFRVILASEPGIEVIGEAADGAEAVELARSLQPDVVLMDIRMPHLDGFEATRKILAASSGKVLILTTFDSDEYVYEALRAGASGFLLKDAPADQLITAVRCVAVGDALIDPSVTRRLIARFTRSVRPAAPTPEIAAKLTARETDVLRLITGPVQYRDRSRAGDRGEHGQNPRRPGADQARPARPGPGRRPRLRDRAGDRRPARTGDRPELTRPPISGRITSAG